jgi:hypothetical protein
MTRTTIITAAGAFMVLSFISACNRDQDQATPVGQQQGQGSAQDYPSTRNQQRNEQAGSIRKPGAASRFNYAVVSFPSRLSAFRSWSCLCHTTSSFSTGLLAPAFPTV